MRLSEKLKKTVSVLVLSGFTLAVTGCGPAGTTPPKPADAPVTGPAATPPPKIDMPAPEQAGSDTAPGGVETTEPAGAGAEVPEPAAEDEAAKDKADAKPE